MLPPLDPVSGYLPPGIYDVSWAEILSLCGGTPHRQRLLVGLQAALKNLASAGCSSVLLDGSFVSSKIVPSDFDGAWEIGGVDGSAVDPVLLDFSNQRAAMKAKYGGELFPAHWQAKAGVTYYNFFQQDKNGVPKGVLRIDPRSLP